MFLIPEVEHYTWIDIYIALVNEIKTTNQLFAMTSFTYNSINYNWVTLGQNYIRYSAEARIYCSAQPSLFPHIVLNVDVSTFCYFNSSIKRLMCAVVVAASCFLSSDKKEWRTAWHGHDFVDDFIYVCGNTLNCSNAVHSIYTHLFTL